MNYEDLSNEELAEYSGKLKLEIDRLSKQLDEAKNEIRRRLTHGGSLTANNLEIKVTNPLDFDPVKAEEVLTAAELEQISERKLSGQKAKKLFGQSTYELMTRQGTPRVSFTWKKD